MRFLILDPQGNRLGDFANPQDLNQPAYQGCSQIEVPDNDPRLAQAAVALATGAAQISSGSTTPGPTPPAAPTVHAVDLAQLLVQKGIIQQAEVDALRK